MNKLILPVSLAMLGLVGIPSLLASPVLMIEDTFTVASDVDPLSGRSTEVGGATWTSSSILGVSSTDNHVEYFTTGAPSARYGGAVNYTPGGSAEVIRVEATMDHDDNTNNWIGLGFTKSATSTDLITHGGPWLRYSGSSLFAYGGNGLSNTFINNVNIGPGAHDFAMELNLDTKVATVFVDNVAQANTFTYTTLPTITGAGFHFQGSGAANGAHFMDDFRVYETAIPEPSSMLLLGLGALFMIGFRRRNAKLN